MSAVVNNAPIPLSDPIAQPKRPQFGKSVDPQEGHITRPWMDYFTQQGVVIALAAVQIASVPLSGQTAAIGATDISDGTLSAGLYRFSYYIRVTTAGGAGHALQVTLDWTSDGVPRSFVGASLGGTVLANSQSETKPIRIDRLSPVRYSVAYAGGAAPVLQYAADFWLDEVDA